ncbi:hypothetical protein BH11PAT1_BH11PAT1_5200 [soil metagenome]
MTKTRIFLVGISASLYFLLWFIFFSIILLIFVLITIFADYLTNSHGLIEVPNIIITPLSTVFACYIAYIVLRKIVIVRFPILFTSIAVINLFLTQLINSFFYSSTPMIRNSVLETILFYITFCATTMYLAKKETSYK